MTKPEVAKLVAVMMAAFPSAKVTADTSMVYERMLGDLDYPAANAAVEKLLATSRWMPTVSEIREAVLSLTEGEPKPGGEAWGEVIAAVGRYGSRRYDVGTFLPPFTDPVTAQAVRALGWVALCDSENQIADRARFIELYDKLAINHRRRQLSDGLPAMLRFRALEEQRQLRTGSTGTGDAIRNVFKLIPTQENDDE